jgi:gamma-glutamylcyclotransferase (GGCT)/AIG2-like uncharacterized protein YtfP
MPHLPLFVFGTLRRGQPNHHYLAGTFDRWLPATLRDYGRISAEYGFPAIAPSRSEVVEGELYFIRADIYGATLARCDELEDIPPGQTEGPYYRRIEVAVETGEGPFLAWAYVDPHA